jgi:hypothetical protein
MPGHCREEVQVRGEAADDEPVDGARHALDRSRPPVRAESNQLGDQRVIVNGDLPALGYAAVDANTRAVGGIRFTVANQPSGRRQKTARGIFCVDACFDGRP